MKLTKRNSSNRIYQLQVIWNNWLFQFIALWIIKYFNHNECLSGKKWRQFADKIKVEILSSLMELYHCNFFYFLVFYQFIYGPFIHSVILIVNCPLLIPKWMKFRFRIYFIDIHLLILFSYIPSYLFLIFLFSLFCFQNSFSNLFLVSFFVLAWVFIVSFSIYSIYSLLNSLYYSLYLWNNVLFLSKSSSNRTLVSKKKKVFWNLSPKQPFFIGIIYQFLS